MRLFSSCRFFWDGSRFRERTSTPSGPGEEVSACFRFSFFSIELRFNVSRVLKKMDELVTKKNFAEKIGKKVLKQKLFGQYLIFWFCQFQISFERQKLNLIELFRSGNILVLKTWTVVVAKLAEWPLSTSEIHCLNPNTWNKLSN